MHWKFNVIDKLNKFKVELENQLGKRLTLVQSNRDKEHMSSEFDSFLKEHDTISQLSAPGIPQQNGMVEIKYQTLMDIMRSMMSFSTLPTFFLKYVLDITRYFLNLVLGTLDYFVHMSWIS